MAERPLLILPTAEAIGPPSLPGGGAKPIMPGSGTQANRIAPSLRRLRAALNRGPGGALELRADKLRIAGNVSAACSSVTLHEIVRRHSATAHRAGQKRCQRAGELRLHAGLPSFDSRHGRGSRPGQNSRQPRTCDRRHSGFRRSRQPAIANISNTTTHQRGSSPFGSQARPPRVRRP